MNVDTIAILRAAGVPASEKETAMVRVWPGRLYDVVWVGGVRRDARTARVLNALRNAGLDANQISPGRVHVRPTPSKAPELGEALRAVIADVRESYPEMTWTEALEHVENALSPAEIDLDNDTGRAYRAVLAFIETVR